MATIVPALAVLLGLFSATAAPAAQPAAQRGTDSTAIRFTGGASATATISVRIIGSSASVGSGLAPPAPLMVPRQTTVIAADGRAVPALVYDFE